MYWELKQKHMLIYHTVCSAVHGIERRKHIQQIRRKRLQKVGAQQPVGTEVVTPLISIVTWVGCITQSLTYNVDRLARPLKTAGARDSALSLFALRSLQPQNE